MAKAPAKPKSKAKAKIGRPSKFTHLDLAKVKVVAGKGWTDDEMADFFEVHRATWYRWKAEFEEFCDALKEWKDEANARVERSLYERALGYSHPEDKIFNDSGEAMVVPTIKHYPPDTTAAIFWLKNRNPAEWRDKQELEHTVSKDVAEMLDAARKRAALKA